MSDWNLRDLHPATLAECEALATHKPLNESAQRTWDLAHGALTRAEEALTELERREEASAAHAAVLSERERAHEDRVLMFRAEKRDWKRRQARNGRWLLLFWLVGFGLLLTGFGMCVVAGVLLAGGAA